MRSTPLQASQRSPFGAVTMWRTTPPPDGIGHVCMSPVAGSKRTIVFGCTFDSLYQMMDPRC